MVKKETILQRHCLIAVLFIFGLLWSNPVLAGSPFLTDDPEPVDYRHHEVYLFSTVDKTRDSNTIQGPAVEYNYGLVPNLQVHIMAPFEYFGPPNGDFNHYGFGDMEIGAKYRFKRETSLSPEMAIYPAIELSTGDTDQGLGNGRTWYRLPLWLQKSWGLWTIDGGGGYAFNNSPGMRNFGFGGLLLQRELGEHLSLGGEIFAQEAGNVDQRGYTLFNLGGVYNFTSDLSLLFSVGHTFTGQENAVAYLGLYWIWGPKK